MQGLIKDFDMKSKTSVAISGEEHASQTESSLLFGTRSSSISSDTGGVLCSSLGNDGGMSSRCAEDKMFQSTSVGCETTLFNDPLRCHGHCSSDGGCSPPARTSHAGGGSQDLRSTDSTSKGGSPPEGLEYRLLPRLSQFVEILLDSPGELLSEEASEQLCGILPQGHGAEVSRHIAELRRRHERIQKGKEAGKPAYNKAQELAEMASSIRFLPADGDKEALASGSLQDFEPSSFSPSDVSSSSDIIAEDEFTDPLRKPVA